jgi:hypothetical protein
LDDHSVLLQHFIGIRDAAATEDAQVIAVITIKEFD